MKLFIQNACFLLGVLVFTGLLVAQSAQDQYMKWKVHDTSRPLPKAVDPGYAGSGHFPGKAPSDAIVLFNGRSTDAFRTEGGKQISWQIHNESLVIAPGTENIYSKRRFGDLQLHVEYMIPGKGADQRGFNNGNSGIFLMDRYEVQVINNSMPGIYADGMAGAIYGQFPPKVNADRGLNEWQSYDIIFERPHFKENGDLEKPAYVTVLHNGVLVQQHQQIMGPTLWNQRTAYTKHDDALPIKIQNHADMVHYRNIWVRDLEHYE